MRRTWFALAPVLVVVLLSQGPSGSCGFSITPPPPPPPHLPHLPQPPQSPQTPDKLAQKLAARQQIGKEFLDAILNNPFETLPSYNATGAFGAEEEEEGGGTPLGEMRLWRDIPNLEKKGTLGNIVLRSIVEPFWQSCIDRVKDVFPNARYRVCAVGTPGIGKTITTPLLLRMLLLKNSTVVYIRRSVDLDSWYYEFIPTSDGKNPYTVNVFPEETTKYSDFPSLEEPSAYYVVDPGESKVSCSPIADFAARVIIISSPNDRHWGEEEFEKQRADQIGVFHYYPVWNLTELLCGLGHFPTNVTLSPQQLAERYREVGGVPRNLFLDEFAYRKILVKQENAAAGVKSDQALRIVSGKLDPLGNLNIEFPKSAVIGIELADNDHGAFTERKAVPISAVAAEQVFLKHITTLWNDMVANERPLVFESYLRTVLTREGYEVSLQGIEVRGTRTSGRPLVEPPSMIGGYSRIQMVPKGKRISIAAVENPEANILFYSSDPQYELIDFVCKDNNGNILAFQATTGRTHTVNEAHIRSLEDEVGQRGLMLFYLHTVRPGIRFATLPATPQTGFCQIYHVPIPMPIQATPPPDTGVLPAVAAEDPMIE